MQKVIRATSRAKTQAERKYAAEQAHNKIVNRKIRISDQKLINTERRNLIKAARIARREDWLMGPLAPRRDVGDSKVTYGTLSPRLMQAPAKEKSELKEWCIREGDRVVIIAPKHRDHGKIGKVKSVREIGEECTVEGLNMVCLTLDTFGNFIRSGLLGATEKAYKSCNSNCPSRLTLRCPNTCSTPTPNQTPFKPPNQPFHSPMFAWSTLCSTLKLVSDEM